MPRPHRPASASRESATWRRNRIEQPSILRTFVNAQIVALADQVAIAAGATGDRDAPAAREIVHPRPDLPRVPLPRLRRQAPHREAVRARYMDRPGRTGGPFAPAARYRAPSAPGGRRGRRGARQHQRNSEPDGQARPPRAACAPQPAAAARAGGSTLRLELGRPRHGEQRPLRRRRTRCARDLDQGRRISARVQAGRRPPARRRPARARSATPGRPLSSKRIVPVERAGELREQLQRAIAPLDMRQSRGPAPRAAAPRDQPDAPRRAAGWPDVRMPNSAGEVELRRDQQADPGWRRCAIGNGRGAPDDRPARRDSRAACAASPARSPAATRRPTPLSTQPERRHCCRRRTRSGRRARSRPPASCGRQSRRRPPSPPRAPARAGSAGSSIRNAAARRAAAGRAAGDRPPARCRGEAPPSARRASAARPQPDQGQSRPAFSVMSRSKAAAAVIRLSPAPRRSAAPAGRAARRSGASRSRPSRAAIALAGEPPKKVLTTWLIIDAPASSRSGRRPVDVSTCRRARSGHGPSRPRMRSRVRTVVLVGASSSAAVISAAVARPSRCSASMICRSRGG